jgi:methyl-accepting chemotaxis protein
MLALLSRLGLTRFKISHRFALLGTAAILVMGLGTLLALKQFYDHLHAERLAQVRVVAESAAAMLRFEKGRAEKGLVSDTEARQAALEAIAAISFNKTNYVFVYTMDGTALTIGPAKERVGKNFLAETDVNGRAFIKDLAATARKGGGMVAYQFKNPATGALGNKVSYALEIAGWDWFVGTGMYTDDIWVIMVNTVVELTMVVGPLAILFAVFGWFLARGLARPLHQLTGGLKRLGEGDLDAFAVAHGELVNGVVYGLLEQDVDAVLGVGAVAEAADIHAGAQADVFEGGEGLDRGFGIGGGHGA